MPGVQSFVTPGRHGYSVRFSPFAGNVLACASGQHYGIVGTGSLFVVSLTDEGVRLVRWFEWNDALFDVSWSECNENALVTSAGDGSIHLWDVGAPPVSDDLRGPNPLVVLREHSKEVSSVCWSAMRGAPQHLLSASWDGLVKVWDVPVAGDIRRSSLRTLSAQEGQIYSAQWSPRREAVLASVAGDGTLAVWDLRAAEPLQQQFPVHSGEALSCDWNKYSDFVLCTSSADASIRGWDLRSVLRPLFQLAGHQLAVRRTCWSPHSAHRLVSASYDFSVRVWDTAMASSGPGQPVCLDTLVHHSEFVYGLDCSIHVPGLVADCSWDQTIKLYHLNGLSPT